jgi:hypothetical protein
LFSSFGTLDRMQFSVATRGTTLILMSGAALMAQGLALPLTHPETAWLIALERLPQ